MKRIAIIADDLTGASDSGVQFARQRLRTLVLFHSENLAASARTADAVAIDTDSRAVSAPQARARAKQAALGVRDAGFAHIYKKVDSTLRGNLGPEIDGIMDAISFDVAILAPAYPRVGRTTQSGRHFLKGLPLEETEIARDPKCPVRESRIDLLLASQTDRKVGLVDLGTLREGPAAVLRQVAVLRQNGAEIVVFDAVEDEDLRRIAETMAASPYRVLWVGSAGLADYLPDALGLGGTTAGDQRIRAEGGPVLLVAGSVSPTTRAQVAAVIRMPGVVAVEMDPLKVLGSESEMDAEVHRCSALASAALAAGHDVALASGSSPEQVAQARELGSRQGMDATEVSNRVATAMGEAAAQVIEASRLQSTILTGGDTAKAVCLRLGVSGLEVLTELEPGVPLNRMAGGPGLLAVTKAGAFGTEETLARAVRLLKGEM